MANFTIGARVAQMFYGERQEGEVIAMRRPDAALAAIDYDKAKDKDHA